MRTHGGGKTLRIQNEIALKQYEKYYKSRVSDCELIIVVGGGLIKYTTQYFGNSLTALLNVAEKYHIPVLFNAFGVEGYEEGNERCKMLRQLTEIPSLKSVTVRDDFETFRNHYLSESSKIKVAKVADPAVWAAEVYNIKVPSNNHLIGLGVARSNIFESYGVKFSGSELFELYVSVAQALIRRGEEVEIFTNGLSDDNITAERLAVYMREKGYDIKLSIPKNPKDLVEIEARYKAIVATRLHAVIIAYSLNIPVVGMVWNDKVKYFGKNIGSENNFIEANELNTDTVCNRLYASLSSTGGDQHRRDEFRNSIKEKIEEFISDVIS